jgi:hypothetical protein
VGVLDATTFVQASDAYIAERRKEPQNEIFVRNLTSAFVPRGGVGLYLHQGSASFRRVAIDPLD